MPASLPLYHELSTQITQVCDSVLLPPASATRLALLVTGIIAAESCVLAQVAAELDSLEVTAATCPESLGRRLRRTLNDPHLTAETCYAPLLTAVIDWTQARDAQGRIVLILDESSHTDAIHLLRISLPYRGGSLPVAWAVWTQNVALAAGHYWVYVDDVLTQVASLLPADVEVVVLADRAYAVPALIDRLSARGWHWVIRLTTTGRHRFLPTHGTERSLQEVIATKLKHPGHRWRGRGQLFKDAGWRSVQVLGHWGQGATEPLVVATDLAGTWTVLALYGRRFWIESGFRNDKSRGWQWERCQVRGVAHHAVLLVALAWATIAVLCLGSTEATARIQHAQHAHRPRHPAKPQPARESLFTLGRRVVRRWVYGTTRRPWSWHLPDLTAPRWTTQWRALLAHAFLFALPPVRS